MTFGKFTIVWTQDDGKYFLRVNEKDPARCGESMPIDEGQVEKLLNGFFEENFHTDRNRLVLTSDDQNKMPYGAMDAIAAAQGGKIDKRLLNLAGIIGPINEITVSTADDGKIIVEWR